MPSLSFASVTSQELIHKPANMSEGVDCLLMRYAGVAYSLSGIRAICRPLTIAELDEHDIRNQKKGVLNTITDDALDYMCPKTGKGLKPWRRTLCE